MCAVIFFGIFIVVQNLFWVTKSRVSALIKPPFEVAYSASLTGCGSVIEKDGGRFGVLLGDNVTPDKITWNGEYVKMNLTAVSGGTKPTVKAFLFDGCVNTKSEELLSFRSTPIVEGITADKFVFSINDGFGFFSIYSPDRVNGYWNTEGDAAMNFSVMPSKENKNLRVATFSSEKMALFHADGEEPLTIEWIHCYSRKVSVIHDSRLFLLTAEMRTLRFIQKNRLALMRSLNASH